MPTVSLNAGTIHYEKAGPSDGRPVVFIHGYSMGSSLWRPLSERLGLSGFSCLAPTWPLGAHTEPMLDGAELTMERIAAMVGELLDALGLEDVVLVGNDTGGAIAQLVATSAPERLGALVLTSCDAFEHFPPLRRRPGPRTRRRFNRSGPGSDASGGLAGWLMRTSMTWSRRGSSPRSPTAASGTTCGGSRSRSIARRRSEPRRSCRDSPSRRWSRGPPTTSSSRARMGSGWPRPYPTVGSK
jgi:pimeloyl-ACP methyl ester carboxylesterase